MSSTPRFKRCRLAQAIALICIAAPLGGFATKALAQDVDLGNLGTRGFRIDGIDAGDCAGVSVSGAGDVNGDGLADLIIGADRADPGGRRRCRRELRGVRQGQTARRSISRRWARAASASTASMAATTPAVSVSGAGDVNGDGLADLIIGARSAPPSPATVRAARAMWSSARPAARQVDLASLGAGGFRIDGIDLVVTASLAAASPALATSTATASPI
jgi:hypothetical protein